MTDQELENQKKVQFYSAAVTAWFNTSFEHDKSLLTLSSGGIALLVTLLTTTKVHSAAEMILYIAALAAFVVCIISVLFIFKRNAVYLEGVVQGNGPVLDPELTKLDNRALLSFGFGIVFALLLGTSAALEAYYLKGKEMAGKESKLTNDSVNRATNLQTDLVQKSANGAAKLAPATPQASTPTPSGSGNGGATNPLPAQPVNSGKK